MAQTKDRKAGDAKKGVEGRLKGKTAGSRVKKSPPRVGRGSVTVAGTGTLSFVVKQVAQSTGLTRKQVHSVWGELLESHREAYLEAARAKKVSAAQQDSAEEYSGETERTGVHDTIDWAREDLGLTWEELGAALRTTGRTAQRWRDDATSPSKEAAARLAELDKVRFWASIVFANNAPTMRSWFNRRILDLNGRTPLEAIHQGEAAKIADFLATQHTGAFI